MLIRTSSLFCRRALLYRSYATDTGSPHALVFLEHTDGAISAGSLSALTAAQKLGGQVSALIVGSPERVPSVVDKAKRWILNLVHPMRIGLINFVD